MFKHMLHPYEVELAQLLKLRLTCMNDIDPRVPSLERAVNYAFREKVNVMEILFQGSSAANLQPFRLLVRYQVLTQAPFGGGIQANNIFVAQSVVFHQVVSITRLACGYKYKTALSEKAV